MYKAIYPAVSALFADVIGPEQIIEDQLAEWLPVAIFCVAAGLLLTAAAVAVILIVVLSKKKRSRKNGQDPS